MPRSRPYLSKRVSARIDEIRPPGEQVGGQTAIEAPIEIIDDELNNAAHYVLRTAKLPLVYPTIKSDFKHFRGIGVNNVPTRIEIDTNKKVTIVCPEDFLRFVACRLSSWDRDLKEVISQIDPSYRFQEGNKYTSGSTQKPQGAMVSFGEYITTITHGTKTPGTWSVGDTLTGGTSGATATVKEITSATITVVEFTVGSFVAGEALSDGTNSATISSVVDEYNKWVINHAFTTNQSVDDLDDDDANIEDGDIFTLSAQEDEDENGTYLCNASGVAPTKLSNSITTVNTGTAIECFRVGSVNDTLTKFHYVPRLNAEEMPDDLIDPLIWHCAGLVLESMGRMEESSAAMAKADALLGNLKLGIKGEM